MRIAAAAVSIVTLAAARPAVAQDDPGIEIGLRAGLLNYQGDLQSQILSDYGSRFVFGGFVRHAFATKWAVRGMLEAGTLAASDLDEPGRANRGFSFEAPLVAVEATVEWLPFRREVGTGLGAGYNRFNPYGFVGLGYTRAEAAVSVAGVADDSRFPEVGDRSDFLAIPVGGGLRYDFDNGLAVGGEVTGRSVLSDYLDGISENASPTIDDYYWSGVLWVSYKLGSGGGRGQGCPTW